MNEHPATEDGAASRGHDDPYGIVVGVDGSAESLHALRWAESKVAQFGRLRPVSAWQYPWWMVPNPLPGAPMPPPAEQFQRETETQVEKFLAGTNVEHYDPPTVRHASPGPTIVTNGMNANLIVVGTRGRGALADSLLGSVSRHVISHATVPVAVIPLDAEIIDPPRRIVVGIDGSENSKAALVWAIQNTPDDVPIEALHTWHYVLSTLPEQGPIPTDTFEAQARQLLDQTVVEAILDAGGTRHDIIHRLEFGDPRNVLGGVSDEADILVVGAQGHRGVAHLVVGSVTTGLTHQPRTATVVVPRPDR